MGQKALTMLMVSTLALVFMAAGSSMATDIPDTIKLESPILKKHKKGIVTFEHKKHAEHEGITCTDCHHVYKDGKNVWKEGDPVEKCDQCHKKAGKPPKDMSKKEKIKEYYVEAMHENCKGCHKKMIDKKSDLYKEVSKCSGCHPKN